MPSGISPEVRDAIATIIRAFDRYPGGIFLGKPPIAEAIEILRTEISGFSLTEKKESLESHWQSPLSLTEEGEVWD